MAYNMHILVNFTSQLANYVGLIANIDSYIRSNMTMIATYVVGSVDTPWLYVHNTIYSYRYSSIISKLSVYFWFAVTINDLVRFINWMQSTGCAIDCTTLSLCKSI